VKVKSTRRKITLTIHFNTEKNAIHMIQVTTHQKTVKAGSSSILQKHKLYQSVTYRSRYYSFYTVFQKNEAPKLWQ